MIPDDDFVPPKRILEEFPNLPREKLMYWVNKEYLRAKKYTVGGRTYNYFYTQDKNKIRRAVQMIIVGNMKDKKAFDLIESEMAVSDNQLEMFKKTG